MPTNQPWPLMVPKSTTQRLAGFDPEVFKATPDTLLYKFVDALCGATGAGLLVNQSLLVNLNATLQTIWFNELDYVFGSIGLLSRTQAESYPYDPLHDTLTVEQWNEVSIKDAWYRARVRDFFIACSQGGTVQGIKTCAQAALATSCDVVESWRYIQGTVEQFVAVAADGAVGYNNFVGARGLPLINEVIVRPHTIGAVSPGEMRTLRDMLSRICPVDVVVSLCPAHNVGTPCTGAPSAAWTPVPVAAATATSSYFQIVSQVTPTALLAQLPPPAQLSSSLLPSQTWLWNADGTPATTPQEARYAAFNSTSHLSYYYLADSAQGGIDSVSYGTLNSAGDVVPSAPYSSFSATGEYTAWMAYQRADSPDNYPGGQFGLHPTTAPAVTPVGQPYTFPYASQAAYVAHVQQTVIQLGGQSTATQYRLPLSGQGTSSAIYLAQYAIASVEPPHDATVSVAPLALKSLPTTSTVASQDLPMYVKG